jgi:hypothetical protein
MNGQDAILEAIYTLHEATEMRFNAMDDKLAAQDTRIDRLERDVRAGFDSMRGGFDAMDSGFARVNERLDRLDRRRGLR